MDLEIWSQRADCIGMPTDSDIEAIRTFVELEGILLDPCYSAKGAAGFIDRARKGEFKGQSIVFLHTGGAAAPGGYDFAFDNADRWVEFWKGMTS